MAEPTSCSAVPGRYCARVDALFNLPGIHVIDVGWRGEDDRDRLLLTVETGPAQAGCPGCGGPRKATADDSGGCTTSLRSAR